MNITLYKTELAANSDKPFNSLSLTEKRQVAAKILKTRPGNWDYEIRTLESGMPAANKFIISDVAASR